MTFADDVNKLLADAYQQQIKGTILDPGPPRPGDLTVEKTGCLVPMSIEFAVDEGLITEEEARAQGWTPRPPAPPPSRRTRLRLRIAELRDQAAFRLYRLIAGHDPEVDCDC